MGQASCIQYHDQRCLFSKLQCFGIHKSELTFACIDWARGDLSIFPDEAFDRRVQVVIPASMRREYEGDRDNKIISDSGKLVVEIANPLYAYSFPDGTPDSFKVTCTSLLSVPAGFVIYP